MLLECGHWEIDVAPRTLGWFHCAHHDRIERIIGGGANTYSDAAGPALIFSLGSAATPPTHTHERHETMTQDEVADHLATAHNFDVRSRPVLMYGWARQLHSQFHAGDMFNRFHHSETC